MIRLASFIHIPRTGGNNLLSALHPAVEGATGIKIFGLSECSTAADVASLFVHGARIYVLHGHTAFGLTEGLQGTGTDYFTVLREPIQRSISEFLWLTRKAVFSDSEGVQIARSWANSLVCANHQTRYLARRFSERISDDAHVGFFDFMEGPIQSDFLAASTLLKSCLCVGRTEDLGESLRLICASLGLPTVTPLIFPNENPRKPLQQILLQDEPLVRRLRDITRWDDRLWVEHALAFNRALELSSPTFPAP